MKFLQEIFCPYCGERIELSEEEVRDNAGQKFIQDCEVCCNPIEFTIIKDMNGEMFVDAKTLDET